MKGFLSKFLRNNNSDEKPSFQSRREPTITTGQRNTLHEIQEGLAPDATFIDFEGSNDVDLSNESLHDGEQTSEIQARAHLGTVTAEHDHFDVDFQDEIEHEGSQPHQDKDYDNFEPPQGFISSWLKSAEENKIIRSLSLKTTLDAAGNVFIHYVAAFGKSHLLRQLIEDGWPLEKQNYAGKTPYDFAVHYENTINVYFIENILKGLQGNFDSQENGFLTREATSDLVRGVAEHSTQANIESFLAEQTESDEKADITSREETLSELLHESTHWLTSDQAGHSDASSADDMSEAINESPETEQNDKINDLRPQESETLKNPTTPACFKCGSSFVNFKIATKLRFCPFCGAEQPDDETPIANTESQSEYNGNDTGLSEKNSDDYQAVSLEEVFLEEEANTWTREFYDTEQFSKENKQTQRSKSVSINFFEEPFNGADEGFDDEIKDIDLQSYQPASRGRNSSDENYKSLGDRKESFSENVQTEEWEIFLDEDLEEQSHPSDQYFEDEDPLEQGKIVEYASRLTSRITSYQSKDRRRVYAFFISILGDFPFYQSYAAIERLIAKDLQIDQIRDAYSVKLLWMTNPNIWSSRRYNRMESKWSVFRNPKLRNSMSWQLASDLVNFQTPNELENLILNDWYAEWLNLPLNGSDTASGLDPAYSLYPTYLYEKRRFLTANVNTW